MSILTEADPDRSSAATPSFAEVFRQNAEYVWRALRYLGVREADLDDATQEVFVVVHRRLHDFEGRSKIRTWLYGIVLRVASDHRKRAHVRRERPTDVMPESSDGDYGGRAEARQLLGYLLDRLDEPKRQVVVLYDVEGFTMPEVADILGVPVQTAYTRLRAARALLKELAGEPHGPYRQGRAG